MATNPTIKPRRGTAAPGAGAINQNELAVDTTNKRIYIGAADGSGTLIGSAPGGSDTQVQFNDGGNLGGDSGLTYNKTTDSLTITGDLAVNGGDITTTGTGTATLFNTNATTLNLGGVATAITMGATSGTTTTIRGGTLVGNTTTQNLFNSTATTLNLGGAATNINMGASTGTTAINNPALTLGSSGGVTINTGGSDTAHLVMSPSGEVRITPTSGSVTGGTFPSLIVQNADTGSGQVQISGGDLYLGRRSTNLSTYMGSRLVFEGSTNDSAETYLSATDPTTAQSITLPNASGMLALVAGSDTQVMFNDGGIALGGDSGLTYNKTTDSLTITGDLAVNGADITTTATGTATLFNTNALTVNMGGAATAVSIGAATGTATINNANTVVTGDLAVNGSDITTTGTGTATLFNTNALTLNAGGAATAITMGDATTSTITLRGGTLVGNTTTQNLFNTTATTLNVGGAAITATIGYNSTASSTTNISTGAAGSGNIKTLNLGTGAEASSTTNVNIGSSNGGTTTINSATVVGAAGTQALFNTVATTMNFAGAATSITMGATSGSFTIRNPTLNISNGSANGIIQTIGAGTLTLQTGGTSIDGTNASITISPTGDGLGEVSVEGGNLRLGTRTLVGPSSAPVGIIFEGLNSDNNETFLTCVDPTTDQTITLPNATGTVALVAGSDTQVLFNDGGSALGGDSGLTYNKTTDSLTITGDLAVNGSDITTTGTGTATLFNTNALTVNMGGAATSITMGDATTATTTVRGGTLVGNTTTQNLFNSTATTINFGGAASSTINIGSSSANSTIDIQNNLIKNVEMRDYFESKGTVTYTGGMTQDLAFDLSTGNVFVYTTTGSISTFTVNNIPSKANIAVGFTVVLTCGNALYAVTFDAFTSGGPVWAGGTPPTASNTVNRTDIVSYVTYDGGTTWYGMTGGLNFV